MDKFQAEKFLISAYLMAKNQAAVSYQLVSFMRVLTVSIRLYTNIRCGHNIATRHWGKKTDLPGISADYSLVLNFGKEVEYTLQLRPCKILFMSLAV